MQSEGNIRKLWKLQRTNLVYTWESSIPEKWRLIKGDKFFLNVKNTMKPHSTLEFLQETQKYINKIRASQHSSPSNTTTHSRRLSIEYGKPPKLSPLNIKASKRSVIFKGNSSSLKRHAPLVKKNFDEMRMTRTETALVASPKEPRTRFILRGELKSNLHTALSPISTGRLTSHQTK